MKYLDQTLNGLIIGLVIALVFVLASCSRCEYLYDECYTDRDRFGEYEVCTEVFDCRTDYGRRVYVTAEGQEGYDASLNE